MNFLDVYQTDADGYFLGIELAPEDRLNPGQYLDPRLSYRDEPPAPVEGKRIRRVGDVWVYEDEAAQAAPEPVSDTVTGEMVDTHRDLLLFLGASIDIPGYGEILVQGRGEDRINLIDLRDEANDRIEERAALFEAEHQAWADNYVAPDPEAGPDDPQPDPEPELRAWVEQDKLPFRDANNFTHLIDPDQMVVLKRLAFIAAVPYFQAAWAIKELDPIPADYTDESRWPT